MAKKKNEKFVELFEKHLKKYELQWHDVKLNSDRKRKLDSIFERVANAFAKPSDREGRRTRFDNIIAGKVTAPIGLCTNLDEIFGLPAGSYATIIEGDDKETDEEQKSEQKSCSKRGAEPKPEKQEKEQQNDALKARLNVEYDELKKIIKDALKPVLTFHIADKKGAYYITGNVIDKGSEFLADIAAKSCFDYEKGSDETSDSIKSFTSAGLELGRLAEGLLLTLYYLEKAMTAKDNNDHSSINPYDFEKLKELLLSLQIKGVESKLFSLIEYATKFRDLVHFNAKLRKVFHDSGPFEADIAPILNVCKDLIEIIKTRIKKHNSKPKGTKNAKRKK